MVLESGTSQTTFYPLMASPSVEKSLAATVGKVDYDREQRFYEIISETLAGGDNPPFITVLPGRSIRLARAIRRPDDRRIRSSTMRNIPPSAVAV